MEDRRSRWRFTPAFRERAVRLVLEYERERPSRWAAWVAISARAGGTAETLRRWKRTLTRSGSSPRACPRRRLLPIAPPSFPRISGGFMKTTTMLTARARFSGSSGARVCGWRAAQVPGSRRAADENYGATGCSTAPAEEDDDQRHRQRPRPRIRSTVSSPPTVSLDGGRRAMAAVGPWRLSGWTDGATATGFAHVALVVDAFARRIVGGRAGGKTAASR